MHADLYRQPPRHHALAQGDVLWSQTTSSMLRGHQDYFADASHFIAYAVVTQTCDLVPEQGIVEYINLAVVRRLDEVLGRRHVETSKVRERTSRLLRDIYLYNVHERGLFYLPKSEDFGVAEDWVVDLRVVLSVHKQHYAAMLRSRAFALNPLFAAKMGQLLANIFARVATPGWEELYPEISAAERVKREVERIKLREDMRLEALLAEQGRTCTVAGCGKPANTYRWAGTGSEHQEVQYAEQVVCADHAHEFDARGVD